MIPIIANNPAINNKVVESAGANVVYGADGTIFDKAISGASSTVDSLLDKGKNALADILTSVGQVVDKYAPSILAGMAGVQYRGTQGSFQSFTYPIRLSFRYFSVTANRADEVGVPAHYYQDLDRLSGFVLCENAKVPLSTTLSEQTAVEEFLNSGFFIE